MWALRLAAAVAFAFAALEAAGWGFSQSVPNAVALVAVGLFSWVFSTLPLFPPPASR